MSFTAELKQELSALPLDKPCCMAAELSALSACTALMSLHGAGRWQLRFQSHSASVTKRIFKLLRQRYGLRAMPRLVRQPRFGGRRQYQLDLTAEDSRTLLRAVSPAGGMAQHSLRSLPRRLTRRICCRRAWIRGMFLGCGTVQDLRRGYRAEFLPPDQQRADYLLRLLEQSGLSPRRSKRRGKELLYFSDGDSLATLLGLMGAGRAVLQLENLRAANAIKQRVSRATNCDQANMMKQLNTAQQQVDHIVAISLNQGLSALPRELEQLARLRLSRPDAGLKELAQLCDPPLTKSGLQHRMRRLMAFDPHPKPG